MSGMEEEVQRLPGRGPGAAGGPLLMVPLGTSSDEPDPHSCQGRSSPVVQDRCRT